MWLIRTAIRRPYTFVVMAMLIALGGAYSIKKTPTDIFPSIDIPVVSVIWNYGGLAPEEMEKRIVNNFERFLTTIVADIDHIESQTLTGIAIVKVYLHPGTDVAKTIAQTTAVAQSSGDQHPALDLVLDHGAARARDDAQRDDARRFRARRRHPRR